MASFDGDIIDGVGVAPDVAPQGIYSADATAAYRLIDQAFVVTGHPSEVVDGVTVEQLQASGMGYGIADRLRMQELPAPQTTYHWIETDTTRVRAQLAAGFAAALSDALSVGDTVTVQLALRIVEQVALAPSVDGTARYTISHTDRVRVADILVRTLGGTLTDGFGVDEMVAATARLAQALVDIVVASDTPNETLLIQIVAQDGIEITAADAVQMLYAGHLSDEVSIEAIYLSPGDNVLTWALNTRTVALTEYQNYAFNSFGRVDDRYVGATSEGLYELTGDDDAGESIISALKTGMVQIGGSRFTSFKAAYLGLRGSGEFILKLEMGDGSERHYAVSARDMETTKVRLGKGLRARYIAFELESTGQDFDLDTIEFVPVVSKRRV